MNEIGLDAEVAHVLLKLHQTSNLRDVCTDLSRQWICFCRAMMAWSITFTSPIKINKNIHVEFVRDRSKTIDRPIQRLFRKNWNNSRNRATILFLKYLKQRWTSWRKCVKYAISKSSRLTWSKLENNFIIFACNAWNTISEKRYVLF